ncbi:hypothetical protein D9611_007556 [Ephemerocybe angulata]|uniref:Uncharacterized protein n=1 Tax=Ephemerocybe angulata TaxID=980116 RepID=A0A8H5BYY4_9AGAR|nr:hypothetical protein D9611_007556 [Tulosesus angulatus]
MRQTQPPSPFNLRFGAELIGLKSASESDHCPSSSSHLECAGHIAQHHIVSRYPVRPPHRKPFRFDLTRPTPDAVSLQAEFATSPFKNSPVWAHCARLGIQSMLMPELMILSSVTPRLDYQLSSQEWWGTETE